MSDNDHTTWRYLFSRSRDTAYTGDDMWEIREVYTDADGELSWTEESVSPWGETRKELADDLSKMTGAVFADVYLDLTVEPPALVPWSTGEAETTR